MKRKIAIFVIAWLSSIILTGVFVYAATPTTTFSIYGGNYGGAPAYTVFSDGTNYFAKDARGVIAYSGTDAATVINDAITASAGSSQHEIELKSEITLADSIILDSFVTLSFNYIVAEAGFSGNMIEATAESNIIINGGTLEGSLVSTSGIFLNLCSDSRITNVVSKNHLFDGISVSNSTNMQIISPTCLNNLYRGVYVYSSAYTTVTGGKVENNTDGLGVGGTSYQVTVQGTHARNNGQIYGWGSGMFVADSSFGVEFNGVSCSGNANGLEVDDVADVNIIGGSFFNNEDSGIAIYGAVSFSEWVTVTGARAFNNGQDAGATYKAGILILNSFKVSLVNCQTKDTGATQDYGILEYGSSDANILIGCFSLSNQVAEIITTGASTHTNLCYNGSSWIS